MEKDVFLVKEDEASDVHTVSFRFKCKADALLFITLMSKYSDVEFNIREEYPIE